MGTICAGSTDQPKIPILSRSGTIVSDKNGLNLSTGFFVRENTEPFYSVYSLHNSPIGSGAFAEVWLCTHQRTKEIRAVKILHKSEISEEEIKSKSVLIEVNILKSLDHPNILKVFEYFEDANDYFIVTEYCEGGDVFDKLEKTGGFTERFAARIMKYLFTGLAYLHSKQVVHRDIKPENLLITGGSFDDFNIKIIDFNIAIKKTEKNLKGVSGTTDYIAPEVFRGVYDEKCDL